MSKEESAMFWLARATELKHRALECRESEPLLAAKFLWMGNKYLALALRLMDKADWLKPLQLPGGAEPTPPTAAPLKTGPPDREGGEYGLG